MLASGAASRIRHLLNRFSRFFHYTFAIRSDVFSKLEDALIENQLHTNQGKVKRSAAAAICGEKLFSDGDDFETPAARAANEQEEGKGRVAWTHPVKLVSLASKFSQTLRFVCTNDASLALRTRVQNGKNV